MWPDTIAAVSAYLNHCFASVGDATSTFGGVPRSRPERFVRLQQAGATILAPGLRDVRLVVECWERSEQAANRLADQVQAWLISMDIPEGRVAPGADGWLGGPYSQPDPDSGCPRSVMTVVMTQVTTP